MIDAVFQTIAVLLAHLIFLVIVVANFVLWLILVFGSVALVAGAAYAIWLVIRDRG